MQRRWSTAVTAEHERTSEKGNETNERARRTGCRGGRSLAQPCGATPPHAMQAARPAEDTNQQTLRFGRRPRRRPLRQRQPTRQAGSGVRGGAHRQARRPSRAPLEARPGDRASHNHVLHAPRCNSVACRCAAAARQPALRGRTGCCIAHSYASCASRRASAPPSDVPTAIAKTSESSDSSALQVARGRCTKRTGGEARQCAARRGLGRGSGRWGGAGPSTIAGY